MKTMGLLCNPHAGLGEETIHRMTAEVYRILEGQVERILVGPEHMGGRVCPGAPVVGTAASGTERDSRDTARAMAGEGAEMIVIVAGDGTYNDALAGMKAGGEVVPIFGIAAGRFNTIYPRRRHDPFVSLRRLVPFRIEDIVVEDVMGTVARVNDEVVGYGFFQTMVSNTLAYSDADNNLMTVDAAKMLEGEVVPISEYASTATDGTEIKVVSPLQGEIRVAAGKEVALALIAQVPDEVNQILCAGFGAVANMMGFQGVVNVFTNPGLTWAPTPDLFPIVTKSVGFLEGDRVHYSGVRDGSVVQIDSTPICTLGAKDVLTVEVVASLGKKAALREPYR